MIEGCPFIISGFADEISNDLEEQIQSLLSLGLSHISLRTIGNKNIGDFSLNAFRKQVKPLLDRSGVTVSSISSPLGKIFIDDHDGFARQLSMARELRSISTDIGCRYVRIFSFYIPRSDDPTKWRDLVMDRVRQFVHLFEEAGLIALHENEKDIYGDTSSRCKDLFETIQCPNFSGIFDFANFVQCGEDPAESYEILKPYIRYFHIKDAVFSSQRTVLCGTGDGRIREILGHSLANGYHGFLTLEPHLINFASFQSLELNPINPPPLNVRVADGYQCFGMQYQALLEIIRSL